MTYYTIYSLFVVQRTACESFGLGFVLSTTGYS
jgi:hypothetical protein